MEKMQKVRLLTVLSMLAFTTVAKSQTSTRLQVGYNIANISVKNDGTTNDANVLSSFNVGVIGSTVLATPLSLEYGLVLTGKGTKQEIYYTNSTTDFYSKRTFNPFYVEVPVNLVLKAPIGIGTKLNFYAGPYVAAGVFGKVKGESKFGAIATNFSNNIEFNNDNPFTSDQEDASNSRLRRFDAGLNAGAGIEFSRITLRLNYGLGLTKIGSNEQNTNDNNKHRVFSLNLGVRL